MLFQPSKITHIVLKLSGLIPAGALSLYGNQEENILKCFNSTGDETKANSVSKLLFLIQEILTAEYMQSKVQFHFRIIFTYSSGKRRIPYSKISSWFAL